MTKLMNQKELSNRICENGGCMSKVEGEQLFNLIYMAKEIAAKKESNRAAILKEQAEDCAVIPFGKQELLFSTDFAPPVGDDLFIAGKIAGLNAISDIYAMGGIPKYALALLMLDTNLLIQEKEQILAGLYRICDEENIEIVGGHTINGNETIIGLSVIGESRNDRILYKQNCHVGDALMISKPLGTGIILRAYYLGLLDKKQYQYALDTMLQSNLVDNVILDSSLTHAMTDITGFGFVGHLSEMLGENKGANIYLSAVPFIKGINGLQTDIMLNDYIKNNYDYVENTHKIKCAMDDMRKLALFDPQTNGPILISVDKEFVSNAKKMGFIYVGDVIDVAEIVIQDK